MLVWKCQQVFYLSIRSQMIQYGSDMYKRKGFEKSFYSFAGNCVPLSDKVVSGIPNLAKSSRKNLIVPLHVGFLHFITLGLFENLSTTIKKYCPFIGLAKSMCSLDQGLSVFDYGVNFTGGVFATITQLQHSFYIFFHFIVHIQPKKFLFLILGLLSQFPQMVHMIWGLTWITHPHALTSLTGRTPS